MQQGYPGHFAPASLKQAPAVPSAPRASSLSGAFRPGLIEASVCVIVRSAPEVGYPGHFAPASLKRQQPQPVQHPLVGYPGHFAPASLKRCARRNEGRLRPGYPGHFAPASLKPSQLVY